MNPQHCSCWPASIVGSGTPSAHCEAQSSSTYQQSHPPAAYTSSGDLCHCTLALYVLQPHNVVHNSVAVRGCSPVNNTDISAIQSGCNNSPCYSASTHSTRVYFLITVPVWVICTEQLPNSTQAYSNSVMTTESHAFARRSFGASFQALFSSRAEEKRAWYTMFLHKSSSAGNTHKIKLLIINIKFHYIKTMATLKGHTAGTSMKADMML